ncbi:MAG: ABC-type multidrug transport system permease component [Halothiobacillaceae bacterium]|nr:MAG: ABC-type multidrug transport system permease component [Halothiobacillaceae bacterium]
MSGKVRALVKKEFLVLSKDWHGLAVLFLMPAAFILIMSMALESAFGEHKSVVTSYALLNQSDEVLPAGLLEKLRAIPGFHAVELPLNSTLEVVSAGIQQGDYPIAVVIPTDFRSRLIKTTESDPTTLPPVVELLLAPTVKPYIQALFSASLSAILIRQKIAWLLNNPDPNVAPTVSAAALEQFGQLNLAEHYIYSGVVNSATVPKAVQQNVPAWLVFAMFFVVIPLSTVFLVERQQGTLLRLRMMNVSPWQILVGKVLPYYCINQLQMVVMITIGIVIVPLLGGQALNMPHSLVGLLIISSACSVAAIGFALLVATLVTTTMQATTTGGVVNIIFGALGGIMVPKFIMPDTMQSLTYLSPMSWGLEGFLDLFLRQADWQAVLPESLYLVTLGLFCLMVAAYRFNKRY